MNCPRCRGALRPHQAPRLVLHGCAGCGGMWLDGDASRKVVTALDPTALVIADNAARAAENGVDLNAQAACPACQRPLERMPIPAAQVTVDVCREHGVWFDRNELQQVMRSVDQPAPTPGQAAPGYAQNTANVTPPQPAQPPPPPPFRAQPPSGMPPMSPPMPPQMPPLPPVTPSHMATPTPAPRTRKLWEQDETPAPQITPTAGVPLGMVAGQYVAPGMMAAGPVEPTGGSGIPPIPGVPGAGPGANAPAGSGWGLGKTALAVGGGVAAVAGVAWLAGNTGVGRSVTHAVTGEEPSGFGGIGDALSSLLS